MSTNFDPSAYARDVEQAARGVRLNADDIDLNRDYRNSRSLDIQSHIETLVTLGRFDVAMMLHENIEESPRIYTNRTTCSRPPGHRDHRGDGMPSRC